MPSNSSLILVERGESGYHTSNWDTGDQVQNRCIADNYNQKCGVTKAQEEDMLSCSMIGWNVAAADPKRYENLPPRRLTSATPFQSGLLLERSRSFSARESQIRECTSPGDARQRTSTKDVALADFDSRVETEGKYIWENDKGRFKIEPKKRSDPEG